MKDLLSKIQKRDKLITAACRTAEGLEWSTHTITDEGDEPLQKGNLPVVLPDEIFEEGLASIQLPEELTEHLSGEVTVALRTSELLIRTMEFPSPDPAEIADMVGFQIDKISPYPLDQLAVAHEILSTSEDAALVLMAAAKRDSIDAIGDTFEKQGVQIHSIDVRVLGWLQLMGDQEKLTATGSEILFIVDGIDFVLAVMLNGSPLVIRSLHAQLDDMTVVDELTEEIGYTLTTLDAERDFPTPSTINFWSNGDLPAALRSKLSKKCGLKVVYHELSALPDLSEGILRRTLSAENRIELIPREWVEYQSRKKMNRKFSIIAGAIVSVWLLFLLIFLSVHKVRDIKLNMTKADAVEITPAAKVAQNNQDKLRALTSFTDRSDSALECLREITNMLPAGDIEFVSYNYKKGKGITLRGTANSDDMVYDFFKSLSSSAFFERLKDQSVNTKTTKGVRRTVYSVTLELPTEEEGK
ncbi:MAG: PilN domain-containing protein [Pontiella sp.]